MKKLHSPSIILEWETVQEGGLARGLAGLRAIREQLAQLAPTFDRTAEVIVCYEAAVIADEDLRALVRQAAEGGKWPCAVVLSAVPKGANYYEKKNVGARLATNEVLLFFDTDLLADPGWLEGMLVPFQKWEVSVVVGATYLDHARLYDMAVALFWIFRPTMPAAPPSSHAQSAFEQPCGAATLVSTLPLSQPAHLPRTMHRAWPADDAGGAHHV